jgi:pSer/pThr/pTyr-binding forkhead associated (FHA) protein
VALSRIKKHLEAVKTILDGSLHPDAQPLEVRRAVVDAIERKVEPVGAGRRVLPYNRLVVRLFAPPDVERPALGAAFSDLDAKVRERLREVRCEPPAGLECKVAFVKKRPADWSDGQLFSVEYQNRVDAVAPPQAESSPTVRITVVQGTATRKSYTISDPLILIGRTAEVSDKSGRVRRNHVAFSDANSTVSRAHARLKYNVARGEFRLLDDGSRRGTFVVRGASTIPVLQRDPRGVRIQSGDEIQLGDARLRVVLG